MNRKTARKQTMNRKTATELVDAMERGFQIVANATGKPASKKQFEQTLRVGASIIPAFYPNYKNAAACASKRGMIAYLSTQPEPTPEEKETLKATYLNLASLLRKPILETFASLPHQHKGQKPAFENAQKEHEAMQNVLALLPYSPLTEALNQTAERYGKSARTMRRAWNRHKERLRKR